MTKRELIESLSDVPDDATIYVGVLFTNGDFGKGDYYPIDDVYNDGLAVITITLTKNQCDSKF